MHPAALTFGQLHGDPTDYATTVSWAKHCSGLPAVCCPFGQLFCSSVSRTEEQTLTADLLSQNHITTRML